MKTLLPLLTLTISSVCGAGVNPAPAPEFTVHEWGTFTSVSSSDGVLLPGVEREEESLPPFVHSHEGMASTSPFMKGWSRPLANVTVRMETPVIYFYTEKPFAATVDVGFKGGSISQWYPRRSGGETPPPVKRDPLLTSAMLDRENLLDFGSGYQGGIQWKVDVLPAGEDAAGRVFKYRETPNWLHPRQTDSALVRTENGETEKYLFYRGLGKFEPPVTFTASLGGGVRTLNRSETATGEMILFENAGGQARWKLLPSVPAGGQAEANIIYLSQQTDWRTGVYEEGVQMLVRAGLFRKEADAMIQTWWTSYFEQEGTRVFWIVPGAFTDKILPLAIAPAPKQTVRVMVGRTEILTPEFETKLLAGFAAAEQPESQNPWMQDRFFSAYSRRVEDLRTGLAKAQK